MEKPVTISQLLARAIALHRTGRLQEANALYRQILALQPGNIATLNNQGLALQGMKRYNQALASYTKAIALKPDYADAYFNCGNLLQAMKRYEKAVASYDKAIIFQPNYTKAHINRGVALQILKRYDEALASYDKAIEFQSVHSSRDVALAPTKHADEVLTSHDKLVALHTEYPEAYLNRGNVLLELMRYDEALASYDKAIAVNGTYCEAYANKANALRQLKRYDEALAYYDSALVLARFNPQLHVKRGDTLREMKRYDEAAASFTKAVELNPEEPHLLGMLLHTKMLLCDWQGMEAVFDAVKKGIHAGKPVASPFTVVATSLSLAQQRKCAVIYIAHDFPPEGKGAWTGGPYAHDKIRIGYFSSDFRNHATAYLTAQLFELHDRAQFETTGFSFGPPSNDAMRTRLEKAFDRFIDVSGQSNAQIVALARSLEIDIAVDLNGFTQDGRTGIFAQRAAPIQVNYLGYPGTMGAEYMDYLIADPVVIKDEHRRYYAEKIAYLPHCYQVNDASKKISEKKYTRKEVGLPEEGFVFCCFNNSYKIIPDVFAIWMRLLQAVEGSVLWLLTSGQTASENLRKEAQLRGIDGSRLIFSNPISLPDHLARHRLADLFLDTFHYNAHTTASDALWAGLPVLTYKGETFASRVAASLLQALDLPELITHSGRDYEARALELAHDSHQLSLIRQKLARNRVTQPLFNTVLFTRNIENAYRQMWKRSQAELPPCDIRIIAD